MNSKKIFRLELLLVLTLFLNHYFVFHGFIPSPLYWLMSLLRDHSFFSFFALLLIGITLSQCIFFYRSSNASPFRRAVTTLILCSLYIVFTSIDQYIDNPNYIDLSLLSSIPFIVVGILIYLEIKNR